MRSNESAVLRGVRMPPSANFPQGSDPNISPKFSGCSNVNASEISVTAELYKCYPGSVISSIHELILM